MIQFLVTKRGKTSSYFDSNVIQFKVHTELCITSYVSLGCDKKYYVFPNNFVTSQISI